jgi:hypothetical protein
MVCQHMLGVERPWIEGGDDVRELQDLERNLRGLTMGVPSMHIRYLPHHL